MQKRENKARDEKEDFVLLVCFCFLLPCFPACCMILLCASISSSDDELVVSLSRACRAAMTVD